MTRRAVIYARLSEVRGGDTEGIERQIREDQAHADRLGLDVVEVLVDNDLSAAKRKARPDFERLMTGIAANAWDVVVLRSLDRWVRRPEELERIIDVVEKSHVRVEARHGIIDLRTPSGRLLARQMTAVAMFEVEQITQRVSDWHADRAARGLPLHSKPGYGYRRPNGSREVTIVDEEADVIREAVRRVLDGESLRSVARDLAARPVPGPPGGWTGRALRVVLLSPRVAGLRAHNGEIVATGLWTPIVDPETWKRLERLLKNPARNSAPREGQRAPRLLTGIAACGRPGCGATLNSKHGELGRRYGCRSCNGTGIQAEPVEKLVEKMVLDVFDDRLDREIHKQDARIDVAAIAEEIIRLEADLAELAAELGDGRLTMPEWKTARAGIDRRLTALRSDLDTAGPSPLTEWAGRPGALQAEWVGPPPMPTHRKRKILAALFDRIVIEPARPGTNAFDPDRIRPIWRIGESVTPSE